MGPWGNKQKSNKHFMHFAKMPGFSHVLLKDVQVSYSSPRETLFSSEAAAKNSGSRFFSYDDLFLEHEYHNLTWRPNG